MNFGEKCEFRWWRVFAESFKTRQFWIIRVVLFKNLNPDSVEVKISFSSFQEPDTKTHVRVTQVDLFCAQLMEKRQFRESFREA